MSLNDLARDGRRLQNRMRAKTTVPATTLDTEPSCSYGITKPILKLDAHLHSDLNHLVENDTREKRYTEFRLPTYCSSLSINEIITIFVEKTSLHK